MSAAESPTSEEEMAVINALSFDSGSIVSLISSITIVGELMQRVKGDRNLKEVPLPSQHFKFIIGAGFASLLAVMFGRLDLSVEDARKHCSKLIEDVFSKRKLFGEGKFKSQELKAAIQRMLEACGVDRDARMLDPRENSANACKVIVCVDSEHAPLAGAAICLRTYPTVKNSVPDCTIVEALCAAFSLRGLFKPATIVETGQIAVSYVGLWDCNPTQTLLEELPVIIPDGNINCVVNIGAGHKQTSGMNSEGVAQGLIRRFQIAGSYSRFYVEKGIQDIGMCEWKKQAAALTHTRSYLGLPENNARINEVISKLHTNERLIPTAYARGIIPIKSISNPVITVCPPPSGLFTGRKEELAQMERCFSDTSKAKRIFVLYGPGGAGKTQLALQFAKLHKEKYRHVFYIDSSSTVTIEADLKSIALGKKVGEDPKDALIWLAQRGAGCLLVYNNADDTTLDLAQFFPTCSEGDILITTRNHRVAALACGKDPQLYVCEMSKEDAMNLLTTIVGAFSEAEVLLKELGYFALAIVQAGAYIRTHCCTVPEYVKMYRDSCGQLLEKYASQVPKLDGYRLTVYATWRMSYAMIEISDQQIYNIMTFMHHEDISEDIFRLAALGLKQYKSTLPISEDELRREQSLSRMLARFQLADGEWSQAAFLDFIDRLRAYSLITVDTANHSYSIHPLVHKWTRSEVADSETIRSCTALLLASCVTPDHKSKDYALRRMLLNHLDALPDQEKVAPQVAGRAKTVYYEAGRYSEAKWLVEAELQAKSDRLGEEHLSTLRCKAWKASIFSKQGRWDEAELLQREVLAVIERVGGNNHPYTLTTKASLADTHRNQGRWAEAEALGQEVVTLSKEVLGNEHSDTTTRMGNLACTLWKQRKWKEAEILDREVIEIKKRLHGNDHQDTQTSIANLATALWSQGQLEEAKPLHEEVLEVSKRVRGRDHPHTLKCMNNLASTYWSLKMWREGEILQKEVVEVTRKVQGDEHPQTLKSKANLAEMYRHQKRWKEAEVLEREVLEMRGRILGNNHPDTIKSLANLALTYQGLGQLSEAESSMESAVDASKRVLGDVHRYTTSRVKWLAAIRQAIQKEKSRSL